MIQYITSLEDVEMIVNPEMKESVRSYVADFIKEYGSYSFSYGPIFILSGIEETLNSEIVLPVNGVVKRNTIGDLVRLCEPVRFINSIYDTVTIQSDEGEGIVGFYDSRDLNPEISVILDEKTA